MSYSQPSRNEIEDFRRQHPVLSNFLGGWFPEIDLDGITEEQAATDFVRSSSRKELEMVLKEGEATLLEEPFPWLEIEFDSNRARESEGEAKAWLEHILTVVRDAARERQPQGPASH